MRKTHRLLATALLFALISMPGLSRATLSLPPGAGRLPVPALPEALSSYSQTATLQWGCPVADNVAAETEEKAVQKVRSECMEQVSREAARKPDVMSVLDTHVVYPDVKVTQSDEGYHLEGTFFLETVVLQHKKPGDK